MKKRMATASLPDDLEDVFTRLFKRLAAVAEGWRPRFEPFRWASGPIFLGGLLLAVAAFLCPASAAAQAGDPPPLHSFDLSETPGAAEEGESDELILMDFFQEAADGVAVPELSPPPSLPPDVSPAASAPPAASAAPAPSAEPPLVNIPKISASEESRSLSAPLQPPAAGRAEPPPPVPAEAAAPVQAPAGYSPLPTVPARAAPVSEPDPFAAPPDADVNADSDSSGRFEAASDEDRTLPLGRNHPLPAPQWDNSVSGTPPGQSRYLTGSPLPQFDSSQSRWIQLEIGQGDGDGRPPAAAPRPTSVYSLPGPAARPEAPAQTADSVEKAVDAAIDQTISQPPAAAGRPLEPEDRERLRHLFSDMLPPDHQGARAPTASQPAAGGPSPVQTAPEGGAAEPAPSRAAEKADEDSGSSSILKAGGGLTLDGHFGAAEILPPLSGQPRQPSAEAPAPAKAPAEPPPPKPVSIKLDAAPPAAKPAPAKSAPAKPAPGKAVQGKSSQGKPAAKASASKASGSAKGSSNKSAGGAKTAPPNLGLMIINETGRQQVGRQYRSVLTQMGYQVVSVGEAKPGQGTAGQTVIKYRPGLKAKAQAVARHLPGKKVLVEAGKGQVQASEIMIFIR